MVTASYNAARTIERTLRSIEAQAYPELQLICVDGASTDETLSIIERFRPLVSHLICEKDRGVADAINKGFRLANGEVRCWLNADDEISPGALHRIARFFGEHPDIQVVTGACRRFYPDGSIQETQVPDRYISAMALRNDIEQPSTFWRTEAHRRAGELDETYRLAFDWEWWNRLRASGARFERINEVLSHYHFTDDNLTSRGAQSVVDEMSRVTATYASPPIARAYQFIYRTLDLHGFYDPPREKLSPVRRFVFDTTLSLLRRLYGREVIDNYNWNWASKQVRGVVWYR